MNQIMILLILVCVFFVIVIPLAAAATKVSKHEEDNVTSVNQQEVNENIDFDSAKIFSKVKGDGFDLAQILKDKETGVEYIFIYANDGVAITPRLSSDGSPVVDKKGGK